ncbi:MAG: hypothetical protein KUG70_07055 [Rhodobacteraceae bacterium]|nr:hypothetical protein [Paracoccaceae bacterium]
MHGIDIQYEFSGDEAEWTAAIRAFVKAIDADEDVAGRFTYRVTKAKQGNTRIHWGQWDVPETVQILQSRDYFKTFATKLQGFSNGTLSPTPVSVLHRTKT